MNLDFWNRGKAKILILIPERVGEEQTLSEIAQYYGTFDWTKKWVKVEREGKNLKISIDGVPPQTGTFYRHTITRKKGWIEGEAGGRAL